MPFARISIKTLSSDVFMVLVRGIHEPRLKTYFIYLLRSRAANFYQRDGMLQDYRVEAVKSL